MGGVWEHYGWCVGALWVVCGSIRERNYRLKKKELFIWAYSRGSVIVRRGSVIVRQGRPLQGECHCEAGEVTPGGVSL